MNDPESAPMSGSVLIARMKKELSEIRIGLLEAATDYLTTMSELTQYEENKNEEQKTQKQSQEPDIQSKHRDTTEST